MYYLLGEEYVFDKTTPIGLTAYEIIPNHGAPTVDGDSNLFCDSLSENHERLPMLRTQATLEVQMKEEEEKTHEAVYSNMNRVDSLKVRSFLRLLDVFGYTWSDAPAASEEVGLDAMVSFLKILDQADLSSATGLECTLKHYNLDRLFKVDRTISHEVNCARLGQTLRALQPVRIGSYDGQHRMNALGYSVIGQFNVKAEIIEGIPPQCLTHGEAVRQCGYLKGVLTAPSESQAFQKIKIHVGTVFGSESYWKSARF